MIQCREIKC